MDRAGVVAFDRHRGTIEACEPIATYRPYVGETDPHPAHVFDPVHQVRTPILYGCALVAALFLADAPGWLADGVLLVFLSAIGLLALTSMVVDHRGLEFSPSAGWVR
jgi:hypothetical protein